MKDSESDIAFDSEEEEDSHVDRTVAEPRTRVAVLINVISGYRDIRPVLQRTIHFLHEELSTFESNSNNTELERCIKLIVTTGALEDVVCAMQANVDDPRFVASCFELLIVLMDHASEYITPNICELGIFAIFEKIVHNVKYLDEYACFQYCMHLLTLLLGNLGTIDVSTWNQLVGVATQAMLVNIHNSSLALKCVECLELLFEIGTTFIVPVATANLILKTLDQCSRGLHTTEDAFASAAMAILLRIFDIRSCPRPLYLGHSAPILAAGLHNYQMTRDLTDGHKQLVTELIQADLLAAVQDSMTRLIDLDRDFVETKYTDSQVKEFQAEASKLLLGILWKEEARCFLESGGVAVVVNIFISTNLLSSPTVEIILAQIMHYVSTHWENEMWSELRVTDSGLSSWITVIQARCRDGSDGLVFHLLGMIERLVSCEGFLKKFTDWNGAALLQSVLCQYKTFPLSTRKSITILIAACTNSVTTFYYRNIGTQVATVMLAQELNHTWQLELAKSLAVICSHYSLNPPELSSEHVRDIVRLLRSKLSDSSFTTVMINLVANTLVNKSRAAYIDRGVLQVVSRAICLFRWDAADSTESDVWLVISDVAHKLDVSRNLATLESHVRSSEGLSFNTPALSVDVLETCCSVVGALASVRSLLPHLIEERAIESIVGMLRCAKRDVATYSDDTFVQIVTTCFHALYSIVNSPIIHVQHDAAGDAIDNQIVQSRLTACRAQDAIIGCFEESLRLRKSISVLVQSGSRLLRTILEFGLPLNGELECRWIAGVTSALHRGSPMPQITMCLYSTTLMVLFRGCRPEGARVQHVKLMKVILEGIEMSIEHANYCTLQLGEYVGALRGLVELAKTSAFLSNTFISRCIGVLGKIFGIFSLSTSTIAQEVLAQLSNTISHFAASAYVAGLMNRLKRCMQRNGITKWITTIQMAEDFKALKALLHASPDRLRTEIRTNYQVLEDIAAVVLNFSDYEELLGGSATFFLELGCLASQMLPAALREQVINSALCRLAEDTSWHSLRWISVVIDRSSHDVTLLVEFVLLRIVSGYSILDSALLAELLGVLVFILRNSQCRDVVFTSVHICKLQNILWKIIHDYLNNSSSGCILAAGVLGVVACFLVTSSQEVFSLDFVENGSLQLVEMCLASLDSDYLDADSDLTKTAETEELVWSTRTILQHCVPLGEEHVVLLVQHRVTKYLLNACTSERKRVRKCYQLWCFTMLETVTKSHGMLHAREFLAQSSNPVTTFLAFTDIDDQILNTLDWKHFVECIATTDSSIIDLGELHTPFNEICEKIIRQTKHLINGKATVENSLRVKKHIETTMLLLRLKYEQSRSDPAHVGINCGLKDIMKSGLCFYELFTITSAFDAAHYSAILSFHLKLGYLVVLQSSSERSEIEEAILAAKQLLHPNCISDIVMAGYVDLTSVVYLSSPIRAAAWLFIDATANILTRMVQRLSSGLERAICLEKSITNCFASLQAIYAINWGTGEVESVLQLLRICLPDRWSHTNLLNSVVALPEGLLHLFGLARAAPDSDLHALILLFAFQHISSSRHKIPRVSESELSEIVAIVKKNLAGSIGDAQRYEWPKPTGSELLQCSLETLSVLVRRKHCAKLCCDMGCIDIMYNVLCAPSQIVSNIHRGLEICCSLAGYGATLSHENVEFVLELLFVFAEVYGESSSSRLGFLILEYFLALGASDLSLPIIQLCRNQIIPMSARSYEEMDVFIQQVYIIRQKAIPPRSRQQYQEGRTDVPVLRAPLREDEIRNIILSNYRCVVQGTYQDDGCCTYIDINSSNKSPVEPPVYTRLRNAIDQMCNVLDDPDMVMNTNYVTDLIPPLCEILVLHTVTTETMCTVIQVLDQISFVATSNILQREGVDVPALVASCSLHQKSSHQFARNLARFCNNVVTRPKDELGESDSASLFPLLVEVMQNWNLDHEIVDCCFCTIHILVDSVKDHCLDVLGLLNNTIPPFAGSYLTSWNWLKCVLALVGELGHIVTETAQSVISTLVGTIRMFMSHNIMVEKTLLVLLRIYREKHRLPFHHLIELEGIELLLTCLKLHANDESISRNSLGLLVHMTSQVDTSSETVNLLVQASAAAPILLVCKKKADDALICRMCLELINKMVLSLESEVRAEKKCQQALPAAIQRGEMQRKYSQFLSQLFEVDSITLLFDVMDNYSRQENIVVLKPLLELLRSLTKDERIRDSAEVLHGLNELQQTITRIWKHISDYPLLELAIDCLVNMACSDRPIGHGWANLPIWLLEIARQTHSVETDSAGMCVEKIVGILGRLAVDSAISKALAPQGSFIILELLLHEKVDRSHEKVDRSLERAIFGLLCTMCESIENAQILIVFNVIPITAGRMTSHVQDEETLLISLTFFDRLILNCGESYLALQDGCVLDVLELILHEYPEMTAPHVHHVANTLLEKVSAFDFQSSRTKTTPQTNVVLKSNQPTDPDKAFRNLLRKGAVFRLLWSSNPNSIESMEIKLAPTSDYLLFRRLSASQSPRIERIFISQIEICPQRQIPSKEDAPASPSSPCKRIMSQSFLKETFEGDCVLHLKIRDEVVLVKTSSIRERIYWDQALQWLVSRRQTSAHF